MGILKSTPTVLAIFPPPGHVGAYTVQDGDNWSSVASREAGRSDPWDLIEFNFATRDPREVNWYLESYLSCTESSDGKNYQFSTGAGDIYLPPADWDPSLERALQLTVLGALTNWATKAINFQRRSHRVTARELMVVGNAIIDGKIRVLQSSAVRGGRAVYDSGRNVIELGRGAGRTITSKALIIHECVHALFDLRCDSMTVGESESMAYVAQSIFMAQHTDSPEERLHVDIPDDGTPEEIRDAARRDAVFQQAWKIALRLLDHKPVPQNDWNLLSTAVSLHPSYSGNSGQNAIFDGV
ncbi:hypothetical protein U8335_20430 [Roseiconus lacunae]|uniref:hypothetical protein n=1 Tax=Roseiconus lacunae TaxID=2605694 RepID=UPI003092D674|nr:hypothetical protein U8335_20430 [Stieleria sp. HD01]